MAQMLDFNQGCGTCSNRMHALKIFINCFEAESGRCLSISFDMPLGPVALCFGAFVMMSFSSSNVRGSNRFVYIVE